ncbi:MAG TPA: phospholipase D-like domain-containing protein [Vicinamibacterales bacterium]|nr:phospholipase D-like domain-containing protein [Vicinamibacterales bacterium]
MKLMIQPDAGIAPLVDAIKRAKKSVDIAIFRFDLHEVEKALTTAVSGPVHVRALIAHTNKGGEKGLRKLEQRLLEAGVTVSRTADDLIRYHGKYAIIDGRTLWVLGFNETRLDVFRSRSFGIVLTKPKLVREAMALFEADVHKDPFRSRVPDLVVSPENSRARLAQLIKAARQQLVIYDPKVSDGPLLRLLLERARNGVDVRVLGKVTQRGKGLQVAKMQKLRLHVRAIVRDGEEVFIGSQSLRGLELDRRREVGVIVRDRAIARQVQAAFEADWDQAKPKDKPKDQEEKDVKKDKDKEDEKEREKEKESAAT